MANRKRSIFPPRSPPSNPIRSFLAALQFLSILPAFIKRPLTPLELGQTTAFFPLVGFLFGVILVATQSTLAKIFQPTITAALTLVTWIIMSGALHLDGFLDSLDGLFGGQSPQKRLEIMKDERVGAFALTGGVLLLLLKFTTINAIPNAIPALLVAPTLGRWTITLSIFIFPYAREEGRGRAMKDHTSFWQVLIASILAFGVSWLFGSWFGVLAALISVLVMALLAGYTLRLIPGLTGDIYGAINEMIELIALLVFATSLR